MQPAKRQRAATSTAAADGAAAAASAGAVSAALDELAAFPGAPKLDESSRQRLAELFAVLDRDGDGVLQPGDLTGCWDAVGGELDTNKDGKISPREFVLNLQRMALARPCPHARRVGPRVGEAATHAHVTNRLAESLNLALLEVCGELHALAANSRYVHGPLLGEGSYAVVVRIYDPHFEGGQMITHFPPFFISRLGSTSA